MHLEREGSLDRVQPEFRPVVAAARREIPRRFPPGRLHSAYVYGSIPRGAARPGRSDLDLMLALRQEPTPADREAARELEDVLDAAHPQIDGAGVLLFGVATLLSDLERYDLGWFTACLCTPLLGPDLGAELPRYRPTSLLARETNGDLHLVLPRWEERLRAGVTTALARDVGRRLTRTGMTLVLPRHGRWTSDLLSQAAIFGDYYPDRARLMARAAALGLDPVPDRAEVSVLLRDLAPWLVGEYLRRHGVKAVRTATET
jgi:hypothetical protein